MYGVWHGGNAVAFYARACRGGGRRINVRYKTGAIVMTLNDFFAGVGRGEFAPCVLH